MKTFAPKELTKEAKESGLLQCPTCGLIWFEEKRFNQCVYPFHADPVRIVLLCRDHDLTVPRSELADHLISLKHDFGEN